MACGPGLPISTQLCAALCACKMVRRTSLSSAELELQLQRVINYLAGEGGNYDRDAGGLSYKDTKGFGLGQGIIPDLSKVASRALHSRYPLDPSVAAIAQRVAEIARDQAVEGLKGGKGNSQKIQQSAKIVCALLEGALEMVLA